MLIPVKALERFLACVLLCVIVAAGWYSIDYSCRKLSFYVYQEIGKQIAQGAHMLTDAEAGPNNIQPED